MVTVHNFTLFMLEGFTFKLIGQALLRILLSVPTSMFLILLIVYIFSPSQKNAKFQ